MIKLLRNFFLLLKSDLFDSKYYLKENPDVAKAKVNPILHYLKFGWKEGRNPSAKFDGNEYLNKRPDVRVAGICPLVHYLKFGKEEDLSFLFEKVKNLESKNKTLEKKLNEKSVEFEQLNRKKIDTEVKLAELTKNFEKLNKKIADLEKFKNDIRFVYNRGINKEKVSHEIEKFFESSELGIIDEKRELEIIVSLTSYPDRIYDIHYNIYSLLKQTLKPNRIILWLGEEQFPNRDKDLSKKLLEFTKYGLTIKYIKDLKSYTKLVPALKEYPNALIVTADDDIFYRNDWLEKLYNGYLEDNKSIICHKIAKIEIKDKKVIPINNWKLPGKCECSSFSNSLLGFAGVLYPPNCLYKDVFNEELFKKLAPTNDDIWFWAMAVLNNTKITLIENSPFPIYVNSAREKWLINELTLFKSNGGENNNQIQFDNVINNYPQIMEKLLNE